MDYTVQDNFEFTTLKEIIIQLLQNTGYLVDLNTTGIATGFDKVDAITRGFQSDELCVIASKPGNGKTAFLLSLLFNIASKSGKTVGVFSPERSATKMFYRMIESETRQSVKKIMTHDLKDSEKEQINAILYGLSKAEIFVDDSTILRKDDFNKRCKQLRNKYGADIIFVDGFELFSCGNITDVEPNLDDRKTMLQDIKDMAHELDIPFVVFSHLTNSYKMQEAENTLAMTSCVDDYISQIADTVCLVHRHMTGDKADFIIIKHQNIQQPEQISLKFIEAIDKFVDL
ncbi:MAG: DnaB-like helicase C-terminal domain-containing protein [Bacteroidales bacterium]|nr:DnaB-like helicase C-terminal domain-containing protein [Bacteroidales bacterium]